MTRIAFIADPLNKLATWDEIKNKRNELAAKPYYYSSLDTEFDFSVESEVKIKAGIDNWIAIPKDSSGNVILFDVYDNPFTFSKSGLQALLYNFQNERYYRLYQLDKYAAQLKSQLPNVKQRDIQTSAWGIA